jgi:DNA-damage-inducible protein D
MNDNVQKTNSSIFDKLRRTDENGNEYWNSREFARAIDYSDYRNFLKVVEKAIEACANSQNNPDHHIVEFNDMIEVGKGAKRSTQYQL